jgi:dTDP-4-amino-4,6-dideoxygalactose transaminase
MKTTAKTAAAPKVPYWKTEVGAPEADQIRESIMSGSLSMGKVTEEFERRFAAVLGVPYAVCTTSGSAALYLAAAAAGIQPGDEVILPNRTFVATAHAMMLAGGSIRLVDTQKNDTLIDEDAVEARLTKKTKAIVAVHLNGNSVDMGKINTVAKKRGLLVIEDAAQGFYSKNKGGFLGAQSDLGCFSLGVTKYITTGQGGVVVTRSRELYEKLQLHRNHGVDNTFVASYERFGFNLKFNDVLASIGLVQLGKLEAKKRAHLKLYHYYREALADLDFVEVMTVKEEQGNIPLWVEALVSDRGAMVKLLAEHNIQVRPFLPDLDRSAHLGAQGCDFPSSRRFARHGIFLPSGPDLPIEFAERTVEVLRTLGPKLPGKAPLKP